MNIANVHIIPLIYAENFMENLMIKKKKEKESSAYQVFARKIDGAHQTITQEQYHNIVQILNQLKTNDKNANFLGNFIYKETSL